METIKFRQVLCIMALTPGLMLLGGCESGSSTVPKSVTAAGDLPATTNPAPKPVPVPVPVPVPAGSATVSWMAPSTRANGDPITMSELGGYRVYYGISANSTTKVIEVTGPSTLVYKVTGLAKGTYYFRVSAFDLDGVEGSQSSAVSKVIL